MTPPARSHRTVTFTGPKEMRQWSNAQHRAGISVGLVPTMGALHRGHLELIGYAQQLADVVVVSIFVNPLQFDRTDDFDRYPRSIEADAASCAECGVDAVYAPTAAALYPPGFQTTVSTGDMAARMEGASRPGHFNGVATVVTKLFGAAQPDLAIFGEKDFQQLAVIRRMVLDLDLGVEIIGYPIVRESDGLARSSRNMRLDATHRAAAASIPRALDAAVALARSTATTPAEIIAAATAVIATEPLATIDYVEVFDSSSLSPVAGIDDNDRHPGRLRIAAAVRIGDVRLIDNRDLFEA